MRTWDTPNGDKITAWRYNLGVVEVRLEDGIWIDWSTGPYVDDDAAWLRNCGVPREQDSPASLEDEPRQRCRFCRGDETAYSCECV